MQRAMANETALIIGGSGQIGRAVAAALVSDGWNVSVTHRGRRPLKPPLSTLPVKAIISDRDAEGSLASPVGSGFDLVVDTIAYDATHARQLVEVSQDVGAFIVISSSSVYCDDRRRSLDEAMMNGFPDMPEPMTESHSILPPGNDNYSTRKVALEQCLLDKAPSPVTILRPCAIHGIGSLHPREWWFIKRMLDRRGVIPLAFRGESRFHTTAAANIAGLASVVARKPASRILNIGDAVCPSVAEIGEVIARRVGYSGRIIGLDDDRYPPSIGATPWSVPSPFTIDSSAARALGYEPLSYNDTVRPFCDWLIERAAAGSEQREFEVFKTYWQDPFDYSAEDALLSAL